MKLEVAFDGGAADLARRHSGGIVLDLQVTIDDRGRTDREGAAAMDLHISTDGDIADPETTSVLGDIASDASAHQDARLIVGNIQIAFEGAVVSAIAIVA